MGKTVTASKQPTLNTGSLGEFLWSGAITSHWVAVPRGSPVCPHAGDTQGLGCAWGAWGSVDSLQGIRSDALMRADGLAQSLAAWKEEKE